MAKRILITGASGGIGEALTATYEDDEVIVYRADGTIEPLDSTRPKTVRDGWLYYYNRTDHSVLAYDPRTGETITISETVGYETFDSLSNGTSAGGALSILLGASITDGDERKLFVEIMGAADARDDIYAVSAYCPISILEHADAAYEWEFNGVHDYEKMDITMLDYKVERKLVKGTLDAAEQRVSDELKAQFPAYVNSLGLKNAQGEPLTLNADGSGSFRDYVAAFVAAAANAELQKGADPAALQAENPWLTIDGNHVKNVDFAAYAKAMGRQKTPPAFDALDLSSGENQLFGDEHQDTRHFTAYSAANSAVKGAGSAGRAAVKTMNPLYYISEKTVPQHWRIRVGTKDRDTSHAIAAILAAKLQNSGKNVDMAMPWGVPHSGDYDLDELFAWMDGVVKGQ